ncbi:hypothetical protein [Gemmata sp. SH-PL17]|uniref:hypothetical protein n=1 Tax=Gemmata sp. SH-PL17 TaxID=1630693 RepID=UPI0012FCD176|nr:hypothetical protein [Gemmata sp. SH-PL17]
MRNTESGELVQLAHGAAELTGTDFEYRKRRYQRIDAESLFKDVAAESALILRVRSRA